MGRLTALLAIDDQEELRLIRANLRAGGYEVVTLRDPAEIPDRVKEETAGLLVVSESLPDREGLELCGQLREFSNIPLIMMGRKNGSAGVAAALNAGADDFLAWPYSMDEFFARVNAVMRRVSREVIRPDDGKRRIGSLVIDVGQRQVSVRGRAAALTPTEFKLLLYLADRQDRVVSHEELLVNIWGKEYADRVHYLRVGIGRLRQKIEQDSANPVYLVTCSGVGYMLQEDNRAAR